MLANLEILSSTTGAYVFVVVLGLLFGSFANVCIYRWPPTDEFPKGRSVVMPGSHCFTCKTPIGWYDNVPLFSWLWLRGKCRTCKTEFSARYLIVEALTGVLFGVAWWFTMHAGSMFEPFDVRLMRFVVDAAFIFVLVVIMFIDLDTMLILNKVTYPSIVIFYGASLLLPEHRWYDGLVGAAVGYGVPWLIGEIYFRVAKREGMGLGDSTLLAAIGALLGWQGVLVALFGGSMLGSIIGIGGLLAGGRKGAGAAEAGPDEAVVEGAAEDAEDESDPPSLMRTEIPFGPYLVAGALFYLFAADWIHLKFRLLSS